MSSDSAPPDKTEFKERDRGPLELELKILCRDPLANDIADELVEIKLAPQWYLQQGPTNSRVAVVDYNADLDVVFAPAKLLKDSYEFRTGHLNPVRRNYAFHQVNVWAVINRTLDILESKQVLGRPIPWASGGGRLLVLPHAGYGENAYYDRATGALHFMYFDGPADDRPVFTCLSHDIVTHELGHAVLDGLKPYYNEVTSADTAGFHEFFGDALAIAASLTFPEVLVRAVDGTKPELNEMIVGKIGEEFGATRPYGLGYLRAGFDRTTMADLTTNFEEHERSSVLTHAFYTFLNRLYAQKLDERTKRKNRGEAGPGKNDVVAALLNAARQATHTFFRALDYCPPAGITYLDYARAILKADRVAYPREASASRDLLVAILIELGIARDAAELEPVAMVKETYDGVDRYRELRNRDLHDYDVEQITATTEDAYRFLDANRRVLKIPLEANLTVHRLYRTRKQNAEEYFPPQEIIIEFVWNEDVVLDAPQLDLRTMRGQLLPLHCGGTLVFDRNGNVLHYAVARCDDARRRALAEYVAYLVGRNLIGPANQTLTPVTVRTEEGRTVLERVAPLRHAERYPEVGRGR